MAAKSNTKQALWVGIGNLCSTGMALVSAMILSRYFNKEDYGTYKQVIYIYSTTQIVFTLGLPRCFSYFLPKLPIEQAKQTIKKINNIFYITGLAFSLLLFFCAPLLADAFKNPLLTEAIRIYSPVAFFLLPTLGLEGILATYQKSEYTALYNIATRTLMLLCVVLPVIIFHGTYQMALWGFVISSFITYILAIYLKNLPVKGVNHQPTTITYRDIWKFSLPLMTASIWGALINSTDQFFISRYFGTEAFANFSNGAVQLPFVGMVMAATVTVLTPIITRNIHEKNYGEAISLWQRSTIKASKLLFPLLIFFIVFAKPLMIVMYGAQYDTSAIYFQIKQLTGFTQILSSAIFTMALGQTKFYSHAYFFTLLFLLPAEYLVCIFTSSPYLVTAMHVLFSFFTTISFFVNISYCLKIKINKLIPYKDLSLLLVLSITAGISSNLIVQFFGMSNNLLILIVGCVVFAAIYLAIAFIFKIEYKEIILSLLPAKFKQR